MTPTTTDENERPRRLLIEVTQVREYGYIHRGLEQWSQTKTPTFGFTTRIEGDAFQNDGNGFWTNQKRAFITFFPWNDRDFQAQLNDPSLDQAVYGWVHSEDSGHIELVFRVPDAYADGLMERLYRSISIVGARRSIDITFYPNNLRSSKRKDYITGIYFNHPIGVEDCAIKRFNTGAKHE